VLLLDSVYLKACMALRVTAVPVLAALGVTEDSDVAVRLSLEMSGIQAKSLRHPAVII
jgi:hypothetical protein